MLPASRLLNSHAESNMKITAIATFAAAIPAIVRTRRARLNRPRIPGVEPSAACGDGQPADFPVGQYRVWAIERVRRLVDGGLF